MAARLGSGRQADDVIGLLDVGNSKTVCVIAEARVGGPPSAARVLGIGVERTRGLKGGLVVALDEAEQSVRGAVAKAEHMAGVSVEEVFLSVACGRVRSSTFAVTTRIEGRVVATADIERLTAAARKHAERDGRALLHMSCISYRLDGTGGGEHEPLGLAGRTLAADLHAVTADEAPLRNMLHVLERAYLSAAGMAPAPYASGLAATTEDEREAGVLSIDIGAGTTGLAAFSRGQLLATAVAPLGGNHITFDIAQALSAPAYEAERIKIEQGTLPGVAPDDREPIAYAPADQEAGAPCQTTKGDVRAIVRGRMLSLLDHLAERMDRAGIARHAVQSLVLTGGGSRLPGLGGLATEFFALPTRIASIEPLQGMPGNFGSLASTAAVGLLHIALDPTAGTHGGSADAETGGYWRRMGQWLREGF